MKDLEKMVCIGCSAGGLDAVTYLVPRLELKDSGMLIVPHLDAVEMLDKLREKGVDAEPTLNETNFYKNTVYVVLYFDFGQAIEGTKPYLRTPNGIVRFSSNKKGSKGCVTPAFIDLANIFRERFIGVVLSGSGKDGSIGSKYAKNFGAKILVQYEVRDRNKIVGFRGDTGEADYPEIYSSGMPRATMKATEVDFPGNIKELAETLNRYLTQR